MRGEETQVAGLLACQPRFADNTCVILPGTHSKWVDLHDGRIASLATRITGELFAVLRTHSVLGRLIEPPTGFHCDAFDRGVEAGQRDRGADLSRQLFSVRAIGLFGELPRPALSDYLSGLLIGSELASALPDIDVERAIVLVGESALCKRYGRALRTFGRDSVVADNTAAGGLWWIARHWGMG
jgi:2-dehydro-3-deoxygalactonokinase